MDTAKYLLISVRADYGGGPEHILSLIRGLSRRCSFVVAAPPGQTYSGRFAEYARMVDLPFRRFSFFALIRLARIVKSENITSIHSHGKGAGVYGRLLGWLTGRPVVHSFHGFHYIHLPPLKRFMYLLLERLLAKRTAVFLNVSVSEQLSCRQAGVLKGARSVVVPNGVIVPAVWPKPAVRAGQRRLVLVNVARHEPEKGVDGVLRIAHELSKLGVEFELWLVGGGRQSAELQEQSRFSGLEKNVRFLGFRDDVSAVLLAADIFVSASHGEGMPLTLLEAMAAGLPSVASDVVGNRDVVEDGETGFLFPLGEATKAAEVISRLAGNAQLYERCSQTAHARALERYSVEVMCERINAIYEDVNANTSTGKK